MIPIPFHCVWKWTVPGKCEVKFASCRMRIHFTVSTTDPLEVHDHWRGSPHEESPLQADPGPQPVLQRSPPAPPHWNTTAGTWGLGGCGHCGSNERVHWHYCSRVLLKHMLLISIHSLLGVGLYLLSETLLFPDTAEWNPNETHFLLIIKTPCYYRYTLRCFLLLIGNVFHLDLPIFLPGDVGTSSYM